MIRIMVFIAFVGSNTIAVKESEPGGETMLFPIILVPGFSGPQQVLFERIKSSNSGNDVAWGGKKGSLE